MGFIKKLILALIVIGSGILVYVFFGDYLLKLLPENLKSQLLTPSYEGLGLSENYPATSCRQIKVYTPAAGNGAYYLDTDGTGPNSGFSTYCEMSIMGGGWTLAINWPVSDGIPKNEILSPANTPYPDDRIIIPSAKILSPARHFLPMQEALFLDRSDPAKFYAANFPNNIVNTINIQKVLTAQPTTNLGSSKTGGYHWWDTSGTSLNVIKTGPQWVSIPEIAADRYCTVSTSVTSGSYSGLLPLSMGYSSCKEGFYTSPVVNFANVSTSDRDMALFIRETLESIPAPAPAPIPEPVPEPAPVPEPPEATEDPAPEPAPISEVAPEPEAVAVFDPVPIPEPPESPVSPEAPETLLAAAPPDAIEVFEANEANEAPLGTLTCSQISSQSKKTIKCHLDTSSTEMFYVSEIKLPFNITALTNSSSPYSGLVGTLYSQTVAENTVSVTAISVGGQGRNPGFQASSFENLSFQFETDQSYLNLKNALAEPIEISYLSPTSTGFEFKTVTADFQLLQLDTSFFIEAFTKAAEKIGVFQFLQLGRACYEKNSAECIQTLMTDVLDAQ